MLFFYFFLKNLNLYGHTYSFKLIKVYLYGIVNLFNDKTRHTFKVYGQIVKSYHGDPLSRIKTTMDLDDPILRFKLD